MATKVLGPWSGGLNLTSNRDLSPFMDDKELGQAVNVIYTREGFVQPRPGFKKFLAPTGADAADPNKNLYYYLNAGTHFEIIGIVDTGTNTYSLIQVVDDNYTGTSVTRLYRVDDSSVAKLLTSVTGAKFTHSIVHSGLGAISLDDPIDVDTAPDYIYPSDTGVLLFTDKVSTLKIADLTLTTVADWDAKYLVPASTSGMIIKDRLFLFEYSTSKMHWGPPGQILDFRVFNDLNTVAVGPPIVYEPISINAPFGEDVAGVEIIEHTTTADGIRAVEFNNNNFYIFKRTATYMFTYQNSPNTDGYLRKINSELGGYTSTNYRGNIIVVNNKGVFRIEGSGFTDLQVKMNFRFEFPLDDPSVTVQYIFLINFNNLLLLGFRNKYDLTKILYYVMDTETGAWSEWDFNYANPIPVVLPGSNRVARVQNLDVESGKFLFTTFDKKNIIWIYVKPTASTWDYHLDGISSDTTAYTKFYFPAVTVKTSASVGDSMLKYKKLYRYYIRLYLSEPPAVLTDPPVWTLSINYNNYRFNSIMNPIQGLFPSTQQFPDPHNTVNTVVYERTYQVRLPQQRAKEFLFELKRKFSEHLPTDILDNPDDDRLIKTGYFFLLSAIWFDYEDKTAI